MAKPNSVYVGCDPEFFIKDMKTNKIVAAYDRIGGTKEAPIPVSSLNSAHKLDDDPGQFAYQEDGAAFEFNIPGSCSWDYAMERTRHMLRWSSAFLNGRGYKPAFVASHEFKPAELTNPKAKIIGCSVDWDAYTESARKPFAAEEFGNFRFAGGHLHLNYDKNKVPAHIMVKFLDLLVGLPSVFWDEQGLRRKFYGKAGLYREKSYGVEYRTLSNFWLRDFENDAMLCGVYGATLDAGIAAQNRPDVFIDAYGKVPWDDVQEAINTEDKKLAQEVISYVSRNSKLPWRYAVDMMNRSFLKDNKTAVKPRSKTGTFITNTATGGFTITTGGN